MAIKELIRNGSFERGHLDFWTENTGTVTIDVGVKKRGYYSAKLTADIGTTVGLVGSDYIEVSEGEIYRFIAHLKNVDMTSMTAFMLAYDSDYDMIPEEKITLKLLSGAFDWTLVHELFIISKEISYMRVFLYGLGVEDTYGYVDTVSLQRIDVEKLAASAKELVNVENHSGLSVNYGEEFFTGIWKEAEYHLYCTSLTGSNPGLQVTIQGYDPNTEQWKNVLVFQVLIAAGDEFKTVLSGLGWKQRVKYQTLGTTVTDCDFKVGVVYKR